MRKPLKKANCATHHIMHRGCQGRGIFVPSGLYNASIWDRSSRRSDNRWWAVRTEQGKPAGVQVWVFASQKSPDCPRFSIHRLPRTVREGRLTWREWASAAAASRKASCSRSVCCQEGGRWNPAGPIVCWLVQVPWRSEACR